MHVFVRFASVVLIFVGSCTTVPKVDTPVFDTPDGSVWLESFPDSTRRVSHPQTLAVAVLEKLLRGIFVQEQSDALSSLLVDRHPLSPVFSGEDVALLASPLTQAFELATAEEAIHFTVLRKDGNKSSRTSGMLVVLDSSLLFALTNYHKPQASRSSLSRPNRSFSRPPRWTLWFDPAFVVPHSDSFIQEQLGTHPSHTVTIDITRSCPPGPCFSRRIGNTEKASAPISQTGQATQQELQILRDKIQQIEESLEQ